MNDVVGGWESTFSNKIDVINATSSLQRLELTLAPIQWSEADWLQRSLIMHITCVEWTRLSVTMVIKSMSLISGESVTSDVHGHCLCKGLSPGPEKGTSCSVAQIDKALIFINPYSEGASTNEFLRNLALYSQVLYGVTPVKNFP